MTRHVMIDIETLGLEPGSVILSIAAVAFDPSPALEPEVIFDATISVADGLKFGMKINPSTVAWHIDQGSLGGGCRQRHFNTVQDALEVLWVRIGPDDIIWANSPNFDCVLIEDAARRVGLQPQWHYRNLRDLRTALAANPTFDKATVPFVGKRHDPVDDCMHQIALLRASGYPL